MTRFHRSLVFLFIVMCLGPLGAHGASTSTAGTVVTVGILAPDNDDETGTNIEGCGDPDALNYNPEVTIDNRSLCQYPVSGCTDPTASNYNSAATIDDGSCVPEAVPNVENFTGTFDADASAIDLSWRNPPGYADFEAVRIVRRTDGVPENPTDGVIVYDGPAERTVDEHVVADTTYYYSAFVRATDGRYSSGAFTRVRTTGGGSDCPGGSCNLPPGGPGGPPDPFADFGVATTSDPRVAALTLADFIFVQPGERLQHFRDNGVVYLRTNKITTVKIDYDRLPTVLKTLSLTVGDPEVRTRTFSFLLRADDRKRLYSAVIGAFNRPAVYPVYIHLLDYQSRTLKRFSGKLVVEGPSQAASVAENITAVAQTVGVVAGGSGILLVSANITSLYDLYLLLIQLIAALGRYFGGRRERQEWGTVYDAVTKRPIDPAYVTVADVAGAEVTSAITDLDGRYGFLLAPGTYTLAAQKTHYQFPSATLSGRERDEIYDNLYFGERLTTEAGQPVLRNIPLDPVGFDWNEYIKEKRHLSALRRRRWTSRILRWFFYFGLTVTILALILDPSWLNIIMLGVYIGIVIFEQIWRRRYPRVTVTRDGEPIPFAVVRAYLPTLNQLVRTVVTDQFGNFYFLAAPGTYVFTVDEKLPDGSYRRVAETTPWYLARGVLSKSITVAPTLPPTAPAIGS